MFKDLKKTVQQLADPKRAASVSRYFKTGKGDYGEGDVFIGLTVPRSRVIAKEFGNLSLTDVEKLLKSKIHEERMISLLILISQYKKADVKNKKEIYELYLTNTAYINNWDLIDLSAEYIVGDYLHNKSQNDEAKNVLQNLARSESVWERRIAIMSTFAFIKVGDYKTTFEIAHILLHDKHDLIQKAVGWMLREVGKRISEKTEIEFLNKHYKTMPRTMLRYAIERFPEEKRKQYLLGFI